MTIEEICNKYIKVKATEKLALHQHPKQDLAFKVVLGKESDGCNNCFLEKYYPLRLPYTCAAQERKDGKNVQFKKISKNMITREEAKELLPIVKALAEGKTIQDKIEGMTDWVDTDVINFEYEGQKIKHRIKPEPKYRPFKSQEECWQEMHKHPDFGWVINHNTRNFCQIDCLYENRIGINNNAPIIFERAFDDYLFLDGTPFGIKEE